MAAGLSKGGSVRLGNGSHSRPPKKARADVCARFGDVVADISDELAGIDDFERLLDRIEAAGAGFHGVGELVCYGTADRLALRLGCEPLVVYLHSGTRIGARQLVAGLRKSTRSIPVSSLPGALAEVTTREAEDILCIYAGRFYDAPADFEAWANRNLGRCGPKRSKRGIC